MKTRCVTCKRDENVQDMIWIEPTSAEDSSEVYLRGSICDDCAVVNWAWRFNPGDYHFYASPQGVLEHA